MTDTPTLPAPLKDILDDFAFLDRSERAELLIETADRFQDVPARIAERPFDEEAHVQRCESDAYVWWEDNDDGSLKFHFAVENPQGLSAKSWAVIMDETLSGQPLEQVAAEALERPQAPPECLRPAAQVRRAAPAMRPAAAPVQPTPAPARRRERRQRAAGFRPCQRAALPARAAA